MFRVTGWPLSLGLGLAVIVRMTGVVLSCVDARPQLLSRWEGQDYTELPQDLCQGTADTLFGDNAGHEYGGVICDRTESSYLLLQRLVGYTAQRKAIWKIIRIYPLSALQEQEIAISAGCEHRQNQLLPIVAVVKANEAASFQVLKAWVVDLGQERLRSIQPQTVSCGLPLLNQQL